MHARRRQQPPQQRKQQRRVVPGPAGRLVKERSCGYGDVASPRQPLAQVQQQSGEHAAQTPPAGCAHSHHRVPVDCRGAALAPFYRPPWLRMLAYLSVAPFGASAPFRHSLRSVQTVRPGYGGKKLALVAVLVTSISFASGVTRDLSCAVESPRRSRGGGGGGGGGEQKRRDGESKGVADAAAVVANASGAKRVRVETGGARVTRRRAARTRAAAATPERACHASDALVTLMDPTLCRAHGTIHGAVFDMLGSSSQQERAEQGGGGADDDDDEEEGEGEEEAKIEPGAVLLLKDVTVLRLARSGSHFNVHPANVVKVFSSDTPMSDSMRHALAALSSSYGADAAASPRKWSLLDAYAATTAWRAQDASDGVAHRHSSSPSPSAPLDSAQRPTPAPHATSNVAHAVDDAEMLELCAAASAATATTTSQTEGGGGGGGGEWVSLPDAREQSDARQHAGISTARPVPLATTAARAETRIHARDTGEHTVVEHDRRHGDEHANNDGGDEEGEDAAALLAFCEAAEAAAAPAWPRATTTTTTTAADTTQADIASLLAGLDESDFL